MCRHLGYLGPPVPMKGLLFDLPHALATQAWAPRDMRGGGTINADETRFDGKLTYHNGQVYDMRGVKQVRPL